MHLDREQFKKTIETRVFHHAKSGHRIVENEERVVDWIFDFRAVMLEPEWLNTYAELFWERYAAHYPFQVCGMETAAIALVAAIVMKGRERNTPVNGLFIRKSRKRTGLMKQLEGTPTTDPVILVDDLINSGQTFSKQIKILSDEKLNVRAIYTVVAYRTQSAYAFATKAGIDVASLFTLEDFGIALLDASPETPAGTFTELWRFSPPSPSHNIVVQKSAPVIDARHVYAGSDAGIFYALNKHDGTVAWSFHTGRHPDGKGILSTPAVHDDTVYFGAYDGAVYALDTVTGALRWKYDDADWVGSSPSLAPEKNMLYIGLEYGLFRKRGGIAALNMRTGELRWSDRTPELTHGSPLFITEENMVVIGSNDNAVYAYNADTGERLWRFNAQGDVKSSCAYDPATQRIFFGTLNGTFFALDVRGNPLFARELGAGMYSTPLVIGDTVFMSSLDKYLYALDTKTGSEHWAFQTGGRVFASPIAVGDAIWIGSNSGRLYELDRSSGRMRSFFQASEKIVNKIAYDTDSKHIFVPTAANEIYCIAKNTERAA